MAERGVHFQRVPNFHFFGLKGLKDFKMTNEWQEYVKDPRTVCKYGAKCYQKNPEHHTTYKHPPLTKNNRGNHNRDRKKPYAKPTRSPRADTKEVATETSDENVKERTDTLHLRAPSVSKDPDSKETNLPTKDKILSLIPKNLTFHASNENPELIKELFLVDMPQDFYKFYECLNEDSAIERMLASVNLELIGPYDLLQGKLPVLEDKELYLIHWRFFYDPPEFQAVLKKKGKSEFHIGYFRDDPKENPVFVARNDSAKDCHIKPMAENIFGAVYSYLQNEKKTSPFTAMACQKLMDKLKSYTEQNNFSLEEYNMKKRQSKIVSKTLHGAGIVVPYDKKTQLGYRRLVENDATIKKLFTQLQHASTQSEKDKVLSELQPVITYASIAVDECDFGTGLEAGIALFCSGLSELEPSALSSLTAAYSLLNREPFSNIIKAHLKLRRKGPNMSVLSLSEK